jgi:nitrogenase subunit NifH
MEIHWRTGVFAVRNIAREIEIAVADTHARTLAGVCCNTAMLDNAMRLMAMQNMKRRK